MSSTEDLVIEMHEEYTLQLPENQNMYIQSPDGEVLVTIAMATGNVTIHNEKLVNEAAKIFWKAVRENYPG